MTDALIYDHVRTPRGKGKKDGSLHQATPVWLLRGLLQAPAAAPGTSTPRLVDDVVLGCVTPVGEQGADIARTAVLDAGWAESVAGVTLSRFCASGLEAVNLAAAKVASGFEDLVVAGGIESMSRWTMGSDGGAWFMDPRINQGIAFIPQGISADLIAMLEGFSRHDLDAYALQSHQRAAAARAAGHFGEVGRAGARHRRPADAGRGRDDPRQRHAGGDGQAGAVVRRDGRDGLRRHRAAQVHDGREDHARAPRGQRVGHRRRRRADADRLARRGRARGAARRARASAAWP